MPDSPSQRPGGSLTLSERARIETLVQRAVDLEHQLSNLTKSDEETAAGLRSHLCEVLSDIIISDPVISCENDCTGKLWRHCFYAPIVVWRKKLSREKKRQGAAVKSLEQKFKKFLSEALTLYDYLVIQYQSKLLPANTQANVQDSSQLSGTASIDDSSTSTEGVVPGLFRLFIHMGDLQRYAESFAKAESCYLCASKLAPGMGNPYNQLAVVSQLKDSNLSCVALYWYCRSLLATHDSFETSTSNLERLFDLNRTYLEEHSRSSSPPIFSQASKKTPADILRAQKAAATKACLAHFVDFHFHLFKESTHEENVELILREKMHGIVRSLESLLHASAFGDALLVKLVLITTFSIERTKSQKGGSKHQVAKDFFVHFGWILSERLRIGVSKSIEKSTTLPHSIRLLQPVGIILEYIGHNDFGTNNSLLRDFWASLACTTTTLRMLCTVSEGTEDVEIESREFLMLKGYQPFTFLKPSYATGSPFVDAEEAVCVLDLQATQSQGGSLKPVPKDDNVMRVTRLINMYDSICSNYNHSLPPPNLRFSDNYGVRIETTETQVSTVTTGNESCGVPVDADITKTKFDEGVTEGGDFVVRIHTDSLANSNVRHSASMVTTKQKLQPLHYDDKPIEQKEHDRSFDNVPTSTGMRPPPGFEDCSVPTFNDMALPQRPITDEQQVPPQNLSWPGNEHNILPSLAFLKDTETIPFGTHTRPLFGHAQDFLDGGLLVTHNPFYSHAGLDQSNIHSRMATYSSPTLDEDTTLLNLGFIDSLWMEGVKETTENPFSN